MPWASFDGPTDVNGHTGPVHVDDKTLTTDGDPVEVTKEQAERLKALDGLKFKFTETKAGNDQKEKS